MVTNETIEANQRGIAIAIQSIAYANAVAIVAMSELMENHGIMPQSQFADVMSKLADLVQQSADGDVNAGADMLRLVHDAIKKKSMPKWKPSVVPGGR